MPNGNNKMPPVQYYLENKPQKNTMKQLEALEECILPVHY
jgi:hypothetical protein